MWMGAAWGIRAVRVAEGGDQRGTMPCFLHSLALALALPRTKMVELGPDFREEPRPGGRKSENFGTQGLESGRADTKILALCAGPSTKSESWAVRLSLLMSFNRALYHSEQKSNESAPNPCRSV